MAMAATVVERKGTTELVPARMLNEFAYCPRLCYLEWVQGEFAHSADTLDGRFQHRRVDRESGSLPGADSEDDSVIHARSVLLSDEGLGAIARIDLVEAQGSLGRRRLIISGGRFRMCLRGRMSRSGFSFACRGFC